MKKRVLVIWAEFESPNFGVRALASGLRDGLPSDWELTFISHRSAPAAGPLSVKMLALAWMFRTHRFRREIQSYDLVIDVGEGDSFASIYGWKRYLKMVLTKRIGATSNVPYVLSPQTLGPWEGRLARTLARWSTKHATGLWARDSASLSRAKLSRLRAPRLASDLVFAVSEPKGGTDYESFDLILNVSGLLWTPNRHVSSIRYQEVVRGIISQACETGIKVALLPHVQNSGGIDDDTPVCEALSAEYDVPTLETSDLDQMRATIRASRLLIGSRMHACLNAVSLGVPTFPLAYSDKFAPLFDDLGYTAGGDLRDQEARPLELSSLLSSQALKAAVGIARTRGRERVAEFLDSVQEQMR